MLNPSLPGPGHLINVAAWSPVDQGVPGVRAGEDSIQSGQQVASVWILRRLGCSSELSVRVTCDAQECLGGVPRSEPHHSPAPAQRLWAGRALDAGRRGPRLRPLLTLSLSSVMDDSGGHGDSDDDHDGHDNDHEEVSHDHSVGGVD